MADRSVAQKTLQIACVLHVALLLAAVAYIILPLLVVNRSIKPPDPIIPLVVGLATLPPLGVAGFYRVRVVKPASETLRTNPNDASAAGRWRQGVLVSLVCCESIVLFGLALRFIGVPWNLCAIFYTVGIFLMLVWTPKLELPPT
jgi:hypothetical protein